MSSKELVLQELDQMPESFIVEILEAIRRLKAQRAKDIRPDVWNAYLESVTEQEEVYQQLADS
jgi:hypothetical protein